MMRKRYPKPKKSPVPWILAVGGGERLQQLFSARDKITGGGLGAQGSAEGVEDRLGGQVLVVVGTKRRMRDGIAVRVKERRGRDWITVNHP
jgi:hypothetical protein